MVHVSTALGSQALIPRIPPITPSLWLAVGEIETPGSWFVIGQLTGLVGLSWLAHTTFAMPYWQSAWAVVMTFGLALVACRVTGETDTTPLGAMGKITQNDANAICLPSGDHAKPLGGCCRFVNLAVWPVSIQRT